MVPRWNRSPGSSSLARLVSSEIPSRVRNRMRSASNSATIASTLNNSLLGGEVLLFGGHAGIADQEIRHTWESVPWSGR